MLFSSLEFLFFFLPLVLTGYFLLKETYRNTFLLLVSLFFYAWGEPDFVLVMMGVIALDYVLALLIARSRRAAGRGRPWLVLAVVSNIGLLFVYKYLNFFTRNLAGVFGAGIPVTSIVLPIGISFFIFQAMSYVLDVYRGVVAVQKNPLYIAMYVSFFPQLIAGPIVRYTTIAKELDNRQVTWDDFSEGVKRFIIGLSKKVILANSFAVAADKAFSLTGNPALSVGLAWLGAIAYAFQIFFDFAGYSEMAIGMGRMFGFHFLENFDYPYIAKSISEFWRRWHISLGSWFRDYVYFPLGGSRVKGKGRLICNLFVVWTLTGIWHGANWTFLAWGLFYFALIAFEKLTGCPGRFKSGAAKGLYRVFTLLCVLCGWVVFRAESLPGAWTYLRAMLGMGQGALVSDLFFFYLRELAVLLVFAVLCSTRVFVCLRGWWASRGRVLRAVAEGWQVPLYMGLFLLSVSYLVVGGHNPFIYFNF